MTINYITNDYNSELYEDTYDDEENNYHEPEEEEKDNYEDVMNCLFYLKDMDDYFGYIFFSNVNVHDLRKEKKVYEILFDIYSFTEDDNYINSVEKVIHKYY